MTGIEKITQERLEHKTKHNRSVRNDAENNKNGQLIAAVKRLLLGPTREGLKVPKGWDDSIWYKMRSKSWEERLIIAGSLIAAEIDRLNYSDNDKG